MSRALTTDARSSANEIGFHFLSFESTSSAIVAADRVGAAVTLPLVGAAVVLPGRVGAAVVGNCVVGNCVVGMYVVGVGVAVAFVGEGVGSSVVGVTVVGVAVVGVGVGGVGGGVGGGGVGPSLRDCEQSVVPSRISAMPSPSDEHNRSLGMLAWSRW